MKILHLVSRSQRRGAEMVAYELADELDRLGHENRVLALAAQVDGNTEAGFPVLLPGVSLGAKRAFVLTRALRKVLDEDPVDLIVGHGGRPTEIAVLARRAPVVWQRILDIPEQVWANPPRRIWWRFVGRRVQAAATLIPSMATEMRRLGFSGPVWEIPNARQPERFIGVDRSEAQQNLRDELGLSAECFILGFVGALVDQKRPERAVEVLAEVRAAGRDAVLVMAGEGPLRASVEQRIAALGVGASVKMLGHRGDVEQIYGGVDLLLLTSEVEGIPGVAIESLMTGCPVVTFPLGGVARVVQNGKNGVVLNRPEVKEMTEAVLALLADPDTRAQYSLECRRHAGQFELATVAGTYSQMFEELVDPVRPGLEVYWYWPFSREEHVGYADAVASRVGRLVVQTLNVRGVAASGVDDQYIICPDLPDVSEREPRSLPWLTNRGRVYIGRVLRRRQMLQTQSFDVVHLLFMNRFTDPLDIAWIKLRYGRRSLLVVTVHDIKPHTQRLPAPVELALLRAEVKFADVVVVPGPLVRDAVISRYGVDPNRIEIVEHPVLFPDLDGLDPEPVAKVNPPMVLFFGTLRENKGIEVLIEAIESIRRDDVQFVFAGRGEDDLAHQIVDLARRDSRVTARVEWIDANEKHRLHQAASVMVLPYTDFQSESGVLPDAYAYQLPIIASDVGSLGPTVHLDGTGWVVPAGDSTALARAIETAIDDKHGLAERAAAAAEVASRRSPENVAQRLREVYVGALARRRR